MVFGNVAATQMVSPGEMQKPCMSRTLAVPPRLSVGTMNLRLTFALDQPEAAA
jgi:hypothetical protein